MAYSSGSNSAQIPVGERKSGIPTRARARAGERDAGLVLPDEPGQLGDLVVSSSFIAQLDPPSAGAGSAQKTSTPIPSGSKTKSV